MKEQTIPKALKPYILTEKDFVRGVSSTVPYVSRITNGDWSLYLPTYEMQRFVFDTESCWALSGINSVDTQLNYLRATGAFSEAALEFFTSNGYIDSSGSFATSERFIEILSGARDNGNSQWVFWQFAFKNGLIPRAMLEYTLTQAEKFSDAESFYNDYFNPSVITPAMTTLGKQFLTYVNLAFEWVQSNPNLPVDVSALTECLQQAPQHIGTPVCVPEWNQVNVPLCPNIEITHATLLYKRNEDGSSDIRDQYQPDNKVLAGGYMITLVVNGVVTPKVIAPIAPAGQATTTTAPVVAPAVVQKEEGIIENIIEDIEEEIEVLEGKTV